MSVPLTPLRSTKGGILHPPSPLTLCEGGRFLAPLGMTWVATRNDSAYPNASFGVP